MSRSYKKNPFLKYGGCSRFGKRQANKAVRRYIKANLDNTQLKGSLYKKIYNSYDIYDVVSYCPKNDSFWWVKRPYHWERLYFWK